MAARFRPANCKCGGRWQDKRQRWRVLKRGGKSLLKCLKCGWKWKSKCKYVNRLQDHTERSRKGMTDRDVLKRLVNLKNLRIDPQTAVVESCAKVGVWVSLKQRPDRQRGGYMFVTVCHAGRKKAIGVHVLQWMARHQRVVPEGYDVHHRSSPPRPRPKPNNIDNLEIVPSLMNQRHQVEKELVPF